MALRGCYTLYRHFSPTAIPLPTTAARTFSTVRLSDNISLLTVSPLPRATPVQHALRQAPDRPLALMLPWLGASQKGVNKYAEFYLSQGFNVLVGTVTPRQLLLPEGGAQVSAQQVVDFLLSNDDVSEYLVHAFSIGAYFWGEILGQMTRMDPGRSVSRKITGVVFDSPADLEQIPVGLPLAMSDRPLVQKTIAAFARLHLRWMEQRATRHYRESRRHFFEYPLDSASLLFLWAQNDPVTSCDSIMDCGARHEARGNKVFYKCWADSKHVRHLMQHPSDYHAAVADFLRRLGHLRHPERFPAHQARAAVRQ